MRLPEFRNYLTVLFIEGGIVMVTYSAWDEFFDWLFGKKK